MLNTTMPVLKVLDRLCVMQEHDPTLQKYWLLARSMQVNYSIVHNSLGKFLTFKGQLYIPKSLVPTIFYEYHDAQGYFG